MNGILKLDKIFFYFSLFHAVPFLYRVAQLNIAEKERDGLKVELSQAKDLAKKDLHSLRQEMEIMRAQHTTDLKCVESKFCEDNHKLQNDFHNERCQLEAEWREERNRLESEC